MGMTFRDSDDDACHYRITPNEQQALRDPRPPALATDRLFDRAHRWRTERPLFACNSDEDLMSAQATIMDMARRLGIDHMIRMFHPQCEEYWQYVQGNWDIVNHHVRREVWLKTPRGLRWQRRCKEIEEKRKEKARYFAVEKILSYMPDQGREMGEWGIVEWLYDNGYLDQEML